MNVQAKKREWSEVDYCLPATLIRYKRKKGVFESVQN